MNDFLQFCKQFSELDKTAMGDLLQTIKTKTYKKGEYLLKEGETCRYLFFINEGLTKSFFYKNDKEFIMRFFGENVLFSVFDSYITQAPSNFMVMALETTTVTLIGYDKMEILCKNHHCMETFFRKLLSVATVKMVKRISDMLEQDATEQYNKFVEENSSILQRINLGDLAKYLGITQQSLSRIRAAQ
jgi:CRP-like cAMP-binding protein